MKSKKQKLKFKPTPISRLFKYKSPLKMVGDPDYTRFGRSAWANRERVVYAHMMDMKKWPMPWLPETWTRAWEDNETLEYHIRTKWRDYEDALNDHFVYQRDEAERDNAAWDYHHENYIAA